MKIIKKLAVLALSIISINAFASAGVVCETSYYLNDALGNLHKQISKGYGNITFITAPSFYVEKDSRDNSKYTACVSVISS